MPAPATESLLDLFKLVAVAAAGLAVFVGTLFAYVRKGRQAVAGSEVAVVSATFADKKSIEKLTEAIEAQTKAERDAAEETRRLRHSVDECTEAVKSSTDATVNMIRFVTRERDT